MVLCKSKNKKMYDLLYKKELDEKVILFLFKIFIMFKYLFSIFN